MKMADERADDASEEHLAWLVQSRCDNQKVTLELYLAIKNNISSIELNVVYAQLAQELAAIAFSLWRAGVFCDLTGEDGTQNLDLPRFLCTLMSHQAIPHQPH